MDILLTGKKVKKWLLSLVTHQALVEGYKAVSIFEHLREVVWDELHRVVIVVGR